jgi:hypothetical protein
VNSGKSDSLPSARQLYEAEGRIREWWNQAYRRTGYESRFFEEAHVALPLPSDETKSLDDLLTGLRRQRARLRTDQQIAEWSVN